MNLLFFTHTMISIILLNWAVFTSSDGGFSVLSPGEMTYTVNEIPTSTGDIELHNYSYRTQDTTDQVFLYSITHYSLPISELHPDSTVAVDDLFDETLETISARISGEILYSQAEKLQNHPARISRVKYNDEQYSLKNKMVLAHDQIYLIEVFSVYDSGADFKVRKFLNSFKLIE